MKYFFLFVLVLFTGSAHAQDFVVEAVGGKDASLSHAGKKVSLTEKSTITLGDKIETGLASSVDVRLQDNSLIRLGKATSIEFRTSALYLEKGSMHVLVPEQTEKTKNPTIRFRLNTSEGTIGVRGTEFIADRVKDTTTVHTLRGEVLFGAAKDFSDLSKFVVVLKGYESSLKVGEKSPSQPKHFALASYLHASNAQEFAPLASRQAGMLTPRAAAAQAQATSAQTASVPQQTNNIKLKSLPPVANNTANQNGDLLAAAASGDVSKIRAAIQAGANPKARMEDSGDTLLHVAAVNERLEAVEYILDQLGFPVDIQNNKGQTALMESANEAVETDVVLLLLQSHASTTLKDNQGHRAVDYAKNNSHTQAITSLLQSWK
jgi:hypothetical protein